MNQYTISGVLYNNKEKILATLANDENEAIVNVYNYFKQISSVQLSCKDCTLCGYCEKCKVYMSQTENYMIDGEQRETYKCPICGEIETYSWSL